MERNRIRDEDRGSRSRGDDRGSRGRDRDEERGGRDREERSSRGRDRDEDRGGRSSRGGRYEYQSRSADDVRQRANKGANDFDRILKDGIKMWKPNDGDNRIRILPPTWEGAKHFGLDIYVHYGVGPDRQSYLCLNKMKGEPDPIAEEHERARRDEDEEYAKELEAKRRVLIYLIDRDHEKEGVQAWAMPWTLDRDIVKVMQDRTTGEVLEIDHPNNGYDITFEKKGSKNRTEYLGVSVARRSSELGKDEWLDFAIDNPLPDQLQYFDYDHIAKVFGGQGAHKGSRDRDRDEDRGGRDRDRDEAPRGRDRDDDRGSRGRDEDRGSSRGRSSEPELTWDSIHDMTGNELEDLIDQENLDIDPKEAKDDEDLADWICEELKIDKPAPKRRATSDDGESTTRNRLSELRNRRGD